MTTSDNPYRSPRADVGSGSFEDLDRPPAGDLEKALAGTVKMSMQPVLKEAWRLVKGVKLITNVAFTVISLLYMIPIVGGLVYLTGDAGLEMWTDPIAMSTRMTELSTDPAYLVTATLVFIPFNAALYLGVWGMGLRRAADQPVTLADAFPWRSMFSAMGVLLLLAPLGLLSLVHPLLGYVSFPFLLLVLWTLPLFLDREAEFVDALTKSATLTRHNWMSMLGLGLVIFGAYMGTALTCGIGLIWFLPLGCNILGESWRQMAGLRADA